MPFDFKLPDIGEGIAEAEIIKWLVKEGETVKEDQPVVQIETDKAVVDLPSPKAGTITNIKYKEGDSVKVGSVLFSIGGKDDKPAKKEAPKAAPKKEEARGKSVVGQLPEAEDEEEIKPIAKVITAPVQSAKILASPAVREYAHENNINLHDVKGSGKDGVITQGDLKKAPAGEEVPQHLVSVTKESTEHGAVERVPMKGVRKAISTAMTTSLRETAQVTMMGDANIDALWAIREKEKGALDKKGIKLTLLPFITKAAITVLKENPLFNASLDGEDIILKKYYNIGIAVETEVGLLVPVVKNADGKSIEQLAKSIDDLADRAKSRQLKAEEMQGGTFTITNYGSYGGKYATPVLNVGESGILGIGRTYDNLVMDKKGKVKAQKTLPLSLTFDHRLIDGANAALFLKTLIEYLEDPDHFLLEVE